MRRIQILLALTLIISVTISLLRVPSTFAAATNINNATIQSTAVEITPTPSSLEPTPSGPPLSLTIALLCFCLIFLAIIGVLVLGVVVRNQNVKEMNKDN